MTAVVLLSGAVLTLLFVFILAVARIGYLTDRLIVTTHSVHGEQHAKCMGMVAAFVGDEFAVRVLQSAATDYDTAEGQADLKRIVSTVWEGGGPSVPALWLRDRADQLRGYTEDTDEEEDRG